MAQQQAQNVMRRKLVIIGDGACGKTSLLSVFTLGYFPTWVEEANERCPGVPIILVGLKKDLREDPMAQEEMRKKSLQFTAESAGTTTAREIGARKYLECSSLTGEGVDDVFEAATRAALLTFEKTKGGGCCVIL
ncbi:hypothetical protein P7C71_g6567, partial [Lecanoromycetidae sp. Uapishka_2]